MDHDKIINYFVQGIHQVFGHNCTIQIYGGGGRILGIWGIVRFQDFNELEKILSALPQRNKRESRSRRATARDRV